MVPPFGNGLARNSAGCQRGALLRPLGRPVPGLATTVIKLRVWPLDLDFNRHVTNGRYFTLADVGRMDYVLSSGAFRVALRHRALPIVGDVWGKFRRELRLFEAFEIHTRMLGWDDKWSFLEHRFVKNGRVAGVVDRWRAHFIAEGVSAEATALLADQIDRPFLREQRRALLAA